MKDPLLKKKTSLKGQFTNPAEIVSNKMFFKSGHFVKYKCYIKAVVYGKISLLIFSFCN